MGIADELFRKEKEEEEERYKKENQDDDEEEEEEEEEEEGLEGEEIEISGKIDGDEESMQDKPKEEKPMAKTCFFKWWLKPSIVYAVAILEMTVFKELMHLLVNKDTKKSDEIVSDWIDGFFKKKDLIVTTEEQKSKSKIDMFGEERSMSLTLISDLDSRIREYLEGLNIPRVECKFRHPLVRSRLEKLMGSNYVQLTDREFMMKLQNRLLVEYVNATEKRIRMREMDEMERVKNLVLTGKIPFAKAPPEMFDHPVMVIERYCQKLIAERRAKIKVPKVNIPNHLYWDDTIDPPSGLSIEKGHMFRSSTDRVCIPPGRFMDIPDDEDIELGYMLTNADFEMLRYEDLMIRRLRECQTVDELYELSDEVIGNLKTMDGKTDEDKVSRLSTSTQ